MLDKVIQDERAWRNPDGGDADAWVFRLPNRVLDDLHGAVQKSTLPITQQRMDTIRLVSCREALQPVLAALEHGRGFVVIDRLPVDHDRPQESQALYWLLGQVLGAPCEQNIEGTLLYDVCDMGHDVSQGARFSVTNAESSFHTDAAFSPHAPDYVGLLCLQTARSGGQSQLISAYSLHNELLTSHRDVLATLYQPCCFDRRGQFIPPELPYSWFPILDWDGNELTARYLHYYIQIGHEQAEQALTPDQQRALSVLESILRAEDLRVEFELQPGQMLFTNNHWILHNRTAFEDHAERSKRRHYVRLWLQRQACGADGTSSDDG